MLGGVGGMDLSRRKAYCHSYLVGAYVGKEASRVNPRLRKGSLLGNRGLRLSVNW